ncbi:MAG TPA: hypothetical protein VGI85_16720 [Chthoniobacterales bacterium]|jgi:hypothetical protein
MDFTPSTTAQYKDRKGGLIFFGLVTVLLGLLAGLFVPLMIFAARMAPPAPNTPAPPNMVPIAVVCGVLAVVLIWLGIGSMMARRWARALLAVWSWSWFAVGLISCAAFAFMAPALAKAFRAARPPGQPQLSGVAQTMIVLVPIFILALIYLVLPLIWGLFYSGRNVKATCEARDPVARWTDRCPLPVLAVSLWLCFGALFMLTMPTLHSVAPLFGLLLSGPSGTVFYICVAAIWGYGAWAIYRLDWRGWWVIFVALTLFSISSAITYGGHDLNEVYSRMGYPPAQVEQMRAFGFSGRSALVSWSIIFTLPFLGYLCYIRKFFPHNGETAAEITA